MKTFIKITTYIFLAAGFIFSTKTFGVTRVSNCTGSWSNPLSWTPNGVPACGDSVMIIPGDTVNITNQQNYSGCAQPLKIVVKGVLWFHNGSKLRLPCGSYLLVYPSGSVQADVGLSNSNLIEICSIVEWNSNSNLFGPACLPPTHPFCATVLPVELVSLNADVCRANTICLKWETATENNSDYYEVQRSVNAVDFSAVKTVSSKAPNGNSNYTIMYDVIDDNALMGLNYYRLLEVDKDQTKTYSKTIVAHLVSRKGLEFVIFPNLNSGEFTAQIAGLKGKETISVFLRDLAGTVVYKAVQYNEETAAQIKVMPSPKLPNGFYFCTFIVDDAEYVFKIVVSNS